MLPIFICLHGKQIPYVGAESYTLSIMESDWNADDYVSKEEIDELELWGVRFIEALEYYNEDSRGLDRS